MTVLAADDGIEIGKLGAFRDIALRVLAVHAEWCNVVLIDPFPCHRCERLPPSWTGAVVDNHMTLAGRSRDPERYVGMPVTPTLADRIAASESGMFTARNQEGAIVHTVFSRSPRTGWSVAIGIPSAEVEVPIRHILMQMTVAGGTLIAFALILAGLVGRRYRAAA